MNKLRESISKKLSESTVFTQMSDSALFGYEGIGAMTDGKPAIMAEVGEYDLIVAGYTEEDTNVVVLSSNNLEYSTDVHKPALARALGQFILTQSQYNDPLEIVGMLKFDRAM